MEVLFAAQPSTSPPDPLSKKEGAPVLLLMASGSPLFWRGAGGEVTREDNSAAI
jgi:hypothetical protein